MQIEHDRIISIAGTAAISIGLLIFAALAVRQLIGYAIRWTFVTISHGGTL